MTKPHTFSKEELELIHHAIARLRADVMAVVFGVAGGSAFFLATIWLVLRGPTEGQTTVGTHLRLLNNYFPGYDVSIVGSFVGLFYGTLTGALAGWLVSFVYNTIADKRQSR